MKTTLTKDQIGQYREEGFLKIDGFLSGEELAKWRITVDQAVRGRGNAKSPGGADLDGDSYYDNVFIQRINLWQDDPAIGELILDPRIGRMCCELEGIDSVRVWHDQALIKRPWDNPTSWHLDCPYWSFHSHHAISIWVALDDATFENGCLYFIPGSHKLTRFDTPEIGMNMRQVFKTYPELSKHRSVAVPMKAGSCSFHNGMTLHGAGANMTSGWRRAMSCAYFPDDTPFTGKRNILPEELFKRMKVGDILNDDSQNPVVYTRAHTVR